MTIHRLLFNSKSLLRWTLFCSNSPCESFLTTNLESWVFIVDVILQSFAVGILHVRHRGSPRHRIVLNTASRGCADLLRALTPARASSLCACGVLCTWCLVVLLTGNLLSCHRSNSTEFLIRPGFLGP